MTRTGRMVEGALIALGLVLFCAYCLLLTLT
jgi:hypothetical protein